MTKITFITGDIDCIVNSNMIVIDANQSEDAIVNATLVALNNACDDSKPNAPTDIFSFSELALTTVRVWCKENDMSIQVYNWIDSMPVISAIDQDGRIEGVYPFGKNVELLMELM